jgi:hypothetical protein
MSEAVTASAREGAAPRRWTFERLCAAAGIGHAVLIATFFVNQISHGQTPRPDATQESIAKYFDENRYAILANYLIFVAALICFCFWLPALWRLLRDAEGGASFVSTVVLVGGIVGIALSLNQIGYWTATANRADKGVDPSLASVMFDMGTLFFTAWVGLMVMLVGTAVIIFRSGIFPRWLGKWAAVIAILFLIAAPQTPGPAIYWILTFDLPALLAFWAFVIWQILISLRMIKLEPSASTAPSAL